MARFSLNLLRLVGFLPALSTALVIGQNATVHDTICNTVDSKIPGRIYYPDSAGGPVYNESQSSYYTDQERDISPDCVFKPQNTTEVSEFVKLVVAAGKNGNTPKFAVRCGGHTLFTGAANIAGGVTIDMRAMETVTLSDDKEIAAVGGGTIWSDIYPYVVPYNRTVIGGRVPGVGVGGFTLGGGKNFLSRRYGWACDNVVGYEVVTASGDVVYATADQNSDLWLALKGGGNNFGIVTRYDLATHPLGLMWGGVMQYNYTQSTLDAEAKAFSNFMNPDNWDDAADMGIILGFQNPGGIFAVENSLFYSEPTINPPTFQGFTSIPNVDNTMSITSVSNLVSSFGRFLPATLTRSFELVYSFKNVDAATYSKLISTWQNGTASLADVDGLQVQFLLQPQAVTNGTNSLGLEAGAKDRVMSVVTAAYAETSDDDRVAKELQTIVDQHLDILGDNVIDFVYLNYADIGQDPFTSYGAENKAQLQAVSKKYDPDGLFQTSVPGGFKLF